MHASEIMIRDDISKLTKHRYAPLKQAIILDIKYAFWHGFINEYIYKDLLEILDKHCDSLWDDD